MFYMWHILHKEGLFDMIQLDPIIGYIFIFCYYAHEFTLDWHRSVVAFWEKCITIPGSYYFFLICKMQEVE